MFEKQIARGMAWLDQHAPGWEQKIDVWRLNLNACTDCVLGRWDILTEEWKTAIRDRRKPRGGRNRDDEESLLDAIRGLQSTDDPSLCSLHDELMTKLQKLRAEKEAMR